MRDCVLCALINFQSNAVNKICTRLLVPWTRICAMWVTCLCAIARPMQSSVDKFQQINTNKFKYWNSLDIRTQTKDSPTIETYKSRETLARADELITGLQPSAIRYGDTTRHTVNYSHSFSNLLVAHTSEVPTNPMCNHHILKQTSKKVFVRLGFSSTSDFNLFASMANAIIVYVRVHAER